MGLQSAGQDLCLRSGKSQGPAGRSRLEGYKRDGILEKDGKPFSFEIITNQGNEVRAKCAEIIQKRLAEVGIVVKIRVLEWAAFVNDFINKRKFEATILGWTIPQDPDIHDVWHSSKTGPDELNFISYKNTEVMNSSKKGAANSIRKKESAVTTVFRKLWPKSSPICFFTFPMPYRSYMPGFAAFSRHRWEFFTISLNGMFRRRTTVCFNKINKADKNHDEADSFLGKTIRHQPWAPGSGGHPDRIHHPPFFPGYSRFQSDASYLFDTYQTYWPRERLSAPAIIVGIDEASLKLCGQWPWPRTQLAALLDKIAACKPAAIGLDIIMPEPDRLSPTKLAQSLPQIEPELRHLLTQLPDNDHLLAASLSRSPVVLGAAGFDVPTSTTASQMRSTPVIQKGGEAAPFVKYFPAVLKSLPILESSAAGQALLNGDMEKGIVRRVPLLACVGDTLAVSLSIEMLRVASGIPAVTARSNLQGIASVRIGDITIPTQPDGEMWVYFSPSIPNRYLSAADIISGRIHADVLERKLILIGLTGQGLLDIVTTSRGERIPGIEVHAQILENIFDQSFLTRPAWIKAAERGIFFLYGLLLLIFVPTMKPRLSPLMALASVATLLVFSWLAYRKAGWLLDAASPSLGLVTIYLSLLISTFVLIDRKRQAAEQALQQEREAAAHIAGEMEAARRIQLGSLPQAETSLSERGSFRPECRDGTRPGCRRRSI